MTLSVGKNDCKAIRCALVLRGKGEGQTRLDFGAGGG